MNRVIKIREKKMHGGNEQKRKINKVKSCFYERKNVIDKPLARLIKAETQTGLALQVPQVLKGHYEQFLASQLNDLDELDSLKDANYQTDTKRDRKFRTARYLLKQFNGMKKTLGPSDSNDKFSHASLTFLSQNLEEEGAPPARVTRSHTPAIKT